LRQNASAHEEAAYRALVAIPFTQNGEHKSGQQQELQRVAMQKGLFSSPAAALESVRKRCELLKGRRDTTADEEAELTKLQDFIATLQPLTEAGGEKAFSKYQRLLTHLCSEAFAWTGQDPSDRLVIFSERIETIKWLQAQLSQDLNLKSDKQVAILHGGMSDTEQQEMVERFGRQDDSIRVLLCSDVASEGLNLHYFCHRLVHFDLPWSLMVFQQRNGRVDRYGQKHQPQIIYLFTESVTEKIKGDLRILEILQTKDEQANKNLGDPSAFLNVFDPEKEVAKVSAFMAEGLSPETVDAQLDQAAVNKQDNEGDWLLELFGGSDPIDGTLTNQTSELVGSLDQIHNPASLFESDYHYATTALKLINQGEVVCQWTSDDDDQIISLTAPHDLQERLRQLPREVQAELDHYQLCANKDRVTTAIEQARQARIEQDSWPQLHYLWPQHPIMEWLGDRALSMVQRRSAPLIQSVKLQPGEQAFILMSLVPNKKGQPLMVEGQVATRVGEDGNFVLEPFGEFAQRAGLQAGKLPNPGNNSGYQSNASAMQAALPQAVATMHQFMTTKQKAFAMELEQRLASTLSDLKRLQDKQIQQLELRLENQIETVKRSRFEARSRQIGRVFDDYRQWVQETLTTEPKPWIQVLAAVCYPTAGA
jgi:hypothetical protein